jgi:hypothetical protein
MREDTQSNGLANAPAGSCLCVPESNETSAALTEFGRSMLRAGKRAHDKATHSLARVRAKLAALDS